LKPNFNLHPIQFGRIKVQAQQKEWYCRSLSSRAANSTKIIGNFKKFHSEETQRQGEKERRRGGKKGERRGKAQCCVD